MTYSDFLWNLTAPVYNIVRNNPVSGYFLRNEIESLHSLLDNCKSAEIISVCDVGTGRGHSLQLLRKGYSSIVAIDKSLKMIRYTKDSFPGVDFIVADILNLPLRNKTFNLILCIGVAEYIPVLKPLLTNLYAMLTDGGYLVLTFSPQNLMTYLRLFSGHKIYVRNSNQVINEITDCRYRIIQHNVTTLQTQYLLQK
jgi:ubiquinone/menaquinone biosynthesis C-methylase UbiE